MSDTFDVKDDIRFITCCEYLAFEKWRHDKTSLELSTRASEKLD